MPAKTKIAVDILDEINRYLMEKAELDSMLSLSSDTNNKVTRMSVSPVPNDEGYMTLLSEGAILYQDGSIRLYLTKGTLKRWYDSIDETYEGYVTTGHVDLNAHPVREGYFRKEDLKLVVDANGRYDLLVKPKVNTELSTIKDLIIQDEPFAISSEFLYSPKEITESDLEDYLKLVIHNKEKGYGETVPITDEINLMGFSFVGNPGNAKSGGYEPSIIFRNEEQRLKDTLLDSILAKLNGEEAPVKEDEQKDMVEEVASETVESTVETTEEDIVDKATRRIEELEAEKAELEREVAELKQYKQDKEAQEAVELSKLEKLNALLSKANMTVEQPTVEKKPEGSDSIFGRKRFGGN